MISYKYNKEKYNNYLNDRTWVILNDSADCSKNIKNYYKSEDSYKGTKIMDCIDLTDNSNDKIDKSLLKLIDFADKEELSLTEEN